jgi:hypothetical protein
MLRRPRQADAAGLRPERGTLTQFTFTADELAAGCLARGSKTSVSMPFGHRFVRRPGDANSPRIKALREFPSEEAAMSAAEPG